MSSKSRKESWKAIPEFDRYEISSKGRVRNIGTGKTLSKDNLNGVTLYSDFGHTRRSVSKMVREMF